MLLQVVVVRDGERVSLASTEIVAGDIIILRQGIEIPADGVLISGSQILVDETSMTGDSESARKAPLEACMRMSDDASTVAGKVPSPVLISGSTVKIADLQESS